MIVLLLAATSAIAKPLARHHAEQGDELILVGRNEAKLERLAADLTVRGATQVQTEVADLADPEAIAMLMARCCPENRVPDLTYCFQGVLPDQAQCQNSPEAALDSIRVNALGLIALLTPLANRLEQAGRGTLVVISSVAGDRGRQSNYVYGSAKALLNTFLEGLRHRLAPKGVTVITVKPGFVDTPMTAEFNKGPLWAQPDTVAQGILSAVRRRRSEVYVPGYWWAIMALIKAIPQPLFNRLKL
ncbi:SDR family oxidoreductase [Ferrimonas balearica]|uniref:SDR family oxidoreductase n=1 Tax=Ferrimonas balearica TaxID=44012 RepID=UPI001C5A481B|nr:SDR family oxidoreductase [Ferrimonas balearica]MBW3139293.1 SDR family oxidoreductase [Ferrimonas balearica]MBY6106357.1 SDR family oxidoreductase [Ferrimonas balearica]MBY6223064.1 SDR family oxidoreductase [Ferrimonas balearica]